MKKVIAIVTLMFAFALSANAQTQKISREDEAKKSVSALVEKVAIDQSLKDDMYTLMMIKYDKLAQAKTDAEKQKVYEAMEHKILASLTPEQRKVVSNDPELLKRLTR